MVISSDLATAKQQLSRIRHRHLNCFLEVARSRKVSAAAYALNISQPAASKTLSELEDILNTKLFERGGKGGLKLTASGTVFLRYAGASIAALKEGLDGLAQARMYGEPVLMIGVLPGVAAHFMPSAVRQFRETHATILRIITGPNSSMLNQLRLGELDLVVGRLARPNDMQGLSFTHLYSEQLVFVVRPGHPLVDFDPFDLSMLERMTLLMPTADGVMRPVVDRFLIAHGVGALPNSIEARSPDFCRQYVLDSDAVWMISRGVVAHDIHDGVLQALHVDTSDTQGPVGLTVRADTDPSPTLRMMMDTVTRAARDFELT
ncbi:MAG: pca operon transcription factor PcaQ [Gammaproteobacteria bacterium]|nr:pca operon transcription factor PcaQ [Gammaproteobacteria bacterium]